MTQRMYAYRKGWDLEEVEVHLAQSRVYAEDCEDCESADGYVHMIEKKLRFKGDLDDKQIQRLLEISEFVMCIQLSLSSLGRVMNRVNPLGLSRSVPQAQSSRISILAL